MHLRRDVEGGLALADAAVALAFEALLEGFHVDRRVEFGGLLYELADIFAGGHAVDGRAEAGAQEGVVEILADDGVVGAADAEDVSAAGDLGVGEQRPAGHGAVPVAVESAERQDRLRDEASRGRSGLGLLLEPDAAPKRERQPQERADAVPE